MNFNLFGFECIPSESLFGFWFCSIKKYGEFEDKQRNLFGLYYCEGEVIIDILWVRF